MKFNKILTILITMLLTTTVLGFFPTVIADEIIAQQTEYTDEYYYSMPEHYTCISQSIEFGSDLEKITKVKIRFHDPPSKPEEPNIEDIVIVGISYSLSSISEDWEVEEYLFAYKCDGWQTFDFEDIDVSSKTDCYIMVRHFKIGTLDGNIGVSLSGENPYQNGNVQTYSSSEGWKTQSKADICFKLYGEFDENPPEELVVDAGGPYIGSKGKSIQFNCEVSGGTPTYSYNWDFGDGSTSNSKNPKHSYSDTGIKTVTLTVKDNAGTEESDTAKVAIGNSYDKKFAVILIGFPHIGDQGQFYYSHNLIAAQRLYNCLKNSYQFSENNIYVIMSKRPDLNPPSEFDFDIIDYISNKDNVREVLKYEIADKIGNDDLLFFNYIGHGDVDELLINVNERISPNELMNYLDDARDGQIIFNFFACKSGSFIKELSSREDKFNNIILTSSKSNEYTSASYNNGFSSYLLSFIEGLNGQADLDNNGHISIQEAFDYSANIHTNRNQHPLIDDDTNGRGHNIQDDGYNPLIPSEDGYYSSLITLDLNGKIESAKTKLVEHPLLNRLLSQFPLIQKVVQLLNDRFFPNF